jgi:hypothetical protein
MSSEFSRFRLLWWSEKQDSCFFFHLETHFKPISLPKTPRTHPINLVKSIHSLHKGKKSPQNLKSTYNKKYFQAQMCFFKHFKGKKHLT